MGQPDGDGRDVGGGSKRSPLLEFMRRDLRDNAPRRPGATAAAKGADGDDENEGVAFSSARAASTAAALRRWRRDVVPASARGERSVLTTHTDGGIANDDDDASEGGSGAESSLDGFAAYASDDSDADENAPGTSADATRRPRTGDDRRVPLATTNGDERANDDDDDDARRHRVARRGATAKERARQEEQLRAREEEAEMARVVELGRRAERDAKRAAEERLALIRRAARTQGMIARYRDERASAAARVAEEARVALDERWRLERAAMTETPGGSAAVRAAAVRDEGSSSSFERKTPLPSAHEARLHLAYVREERARAGDARCRLCDRGELHSALECSLCEAPASYHVDASDGSYGGHIAGRRERHGDPASVAAGELLSASGQAEVDRWRALTSKLARSSTSELRLTRKGLVSFPDAFLDGFHGLTSLWLARNRLTSLPDLGRLTPLLERLEVSARETQKIKSCVFFSVSLWVFPEAPGLALGTPRVRFFGEARARPRGRPARAGRCPRAIRVGERSRCLPEGFRARSRRGWRPREALPHARRHPRKQRRVSRTKRSPPRSSPWLPQRVRAGPVRVSSGMETSPEGVLRSHVRCFTELFFVGRHPRKVSGRPGGVPESSVWLREVPLQSPRREFWAMTRVFGFIFSNHGHSQKSP